MRSKVENLFNLTNYRDHPEHKEYMVFFFYHFEQGNYFQHLLNQNGVEHELFIEEEDKPIMLFGVRKRHFKQVLELNNMSYARYKTPFIPNRWIRFAILGFTIAMVLMAIAGYIITRK